jgi:tetratricopeptide (TPR) repeat protein
MLCAWTMDCDTGNRVTLNDWEPPRTLDDTQPREAAVVGELLDEPRRGCGNTLLSGLVLVVLLAMGLATVTFAGVAGWRDGGIARQTQRAVALAGTLDRQATLGWQDLENRQYELAFYRCDYVATLRPTYPEMRACISTAQAGLNATSTPTATRTLTPATPTPSFTPPPEGSGAFSTEELFARGQEAMRRADYESAMSWLEALRALDANFQRREVEQMLLTTYQALGSQYRFEGRLGEMIVVIRKALRIDPLRDTDWAFTVNAAELYLSARSHLDAGNVALAAQVFRNLMSIAPTFSTDTRTLACRAFAAAGDSASMSQFNCQ